MCRITVPEGIDEYYAGTIRFLCSRFYNILILYLGEGTIFFQRWEWFIMENLGKWIEGKFFPFRYNVEGDFVYKVNGLMNIISSAKYVAIRE